MTTLATSRLVAFLATTDAARARAFYTDVVGLGLVSEDPFALVLDAHGTMLRVQKVEKLIPPGHTALGWQVTDLGVTVGELEKKGVVFERYGFLEQDDRGVWTSPSGAKIAWFKDPDGNTLSLTEM